MEYTIPHYFEQFRCVAAECTDTCCAGWAIMIDGKSLEKYEKLEGAFGNRVKNSVNWEEGCFHQCNKRCAFLNEDNLCEMHLEGGENMLCDTCRDYPRHMEEFEGLREGSLSISCIEAAKIVLGCEEPVRFITLKDDVEDEEYEEFDFLLFTKLMDSREAILKMLQNREIDIKIRIAVVLNLVQQIQDAIDNDEIFKMDDLLEKFKEVDYLLDFQKQTDRHRIGEQEYCRVIRKVFRIFSKLEVLKEDWPEQVKKAERLLFIDGQKTYEENRVRFQKEVGLKGENYDVWSRWMEQLTVYFVFTYFCGAVYDDNALGKMQIAVVSTMLIQELSIAAWIEQDRKFDFMDFVEIAHRVSREIEHSDINIVRMEKLFEKNQLFETGQLLKLILY